VFRVTEKHSLKARMEIEESRRKGVHEEKRERGEGISLQ
jgi:hypothetical protein